MSDNATGSSDEHDTAVPQVERLFSQPFEVTLPEPTSGHFRRFLSDCRYKCRDPNFALVVTSKSVEELVTVLTFTRKLAAEAGELTEGEMLPYPVSWLLSSTIWMQQKAAATHTAKLLTDALMKSKRAAETLQAKDKRTLTDIEAFSLDFYESIGNLWQELNNSRTEGDHNPHYFPAVALTVEQATIESFGSRLSEEFEEALNRESSSARINRDWNFSRGGFELARRRDTSVRALVLAVFCISAIHTATTSMQ